MYTMFKGIFSKRERFLNAPTRCLPMLKKASAFFRHASIFKTRVPTRACPFKKTRVFAHLRDSNPCLESRERKKQKLREQQRENREVAEIYP